MQYTVESFWANTVYDHFKNVDRNAKKMSLLFIRSTQSSPTHNGCSNVNVAICKWSNK